MANVKVMFKFFDHVELIIELFSDGDEEKKTLLNMFFKRVLLVCDGLDGPDLEWNGIALVARDDLPEELEEINDEFLNEAWSHY